MFLLDGSLDGLEGVDSEGFLWQGKVMPAGRDHQRHLTDREELFRVWRATGALGHQVQVSQDQGFAFSGESHHLSVYRLEVVIHAHWTTCAASDVEIGRIEISASKEVGTEIPGPQRADWAS